MRIQITIAPCVRLAVLVGAVTLGLTACARTHYAEYPMLSRSSDDIVFVGVVDSIEVRIVRHGLSPRYRIRARVIEPVYGDPPEHVWIGTCYPHCSGGAWFETGDGIVAALHRPKSREGRDGSFWPFFVRYFFDPIANGDQPLFELVRTRAERPYLTGVANDADFPPNPTPGVRPWRRDARTLAELIADMEDFYGRRQYWRRRYRGFRRDPWYEKPNAAERQALETWNQ